MTITIYSHQDCLDHDPGDSHPESPARLNSVMSALQQSAISDQFIFKAAPLADDAKLSLAHTREHINLIKNSLPEAGRQALDADTILSPGSLQAALRGAGAACAGIDDLFSNKAKTVFCATRPPGHHACHNQAMGFCLFNNIVIAALYAQKQYGLNRVAIVDFDVHHGNGSQDIALKNPGIFYISTHQSPFYPGTGNTSENRSDTIFNIPLEAGTNHQSYIKTFEVNVLAALKDFKPELILVSAGFDAHQKDPLANLSLTEESYSWLGTQLKLTANALCEGKILSVLEGGYHIDALGKCVHSYLSGLKLE